MTAVSDTASPCNSFIISLVILGGNPRSHHLSAIVWSSMAGGSPPTAGDWVGPARQFQANVRKILSPVATGVRYVVSLIWLRQRP